MKVPSLPTDIEMPPLDQTHPSIETPPSATIRRLPLAPLGGWYWLRDNPAKSALQLAPQSKPPSFRVSRSRRLRLCGKRIALWFLLWYVAFQIGPTLLKDRWHRIGPHYEFHKWTELEQLVAEDPTRPLLVMVGSSRTSWDFHAGSLDGMPDGDGRPLLVYNFGVPSTGPCFQLFWLRDMLAKGIRPRFLLVEFLPALLCEPKHGYMAEDAMLEFESLSLRRMTQWMPYLRNPKKWANLWLEARIAPCYIFRNHLVVELTSLITGQPMPKHTPLDSRGWHVAPATVSPLVHET
jgi:hypothetical protein